MVMVPTKGPRGDSFRIPIHRSRYSVSDQCLVLLQVSTLELGEFQKIKPSIPFTYQIILLLPSSHPPYQNKRSVQAAAPANIRVILRLYCDLHMGRLECKRWDKTISNHQARDSAPTLLKKKPTPYRRCLGLPKHLPWIAPSFPSFPGFHSEHGNHPRLPSNPPPGRTTISMAGVYLRHR